jgi:uncharacterized protein (TIGR03435 family)
MIWTVIIMGVRMQNPIPLGRGRWGEVLVSALVLIAPIAVGPCRAQDTLAASATADCPADPRLPAFEVSAITPVAEKDRRATNIGQYGLPQFSMMGVSLSLLLSFSLDVQPSDFIDAPHGLDNALFDVQVKSADGSSLTYEALKPRMQQMMEQRFCLKAHTGTKEVAGYSLVIAKGGAKVTPGNTPGERGSGYIMPNEVSGTNIEIGALASLLASPAGRPVQDQTGLRGKYTVKVQFAPAADAESTRPSIFTAVEEHLGLELKPARVPVPTLIIEHVNLTPTGN